MTAHRYSLAYPQRVEFGLGTGLLIFVVGIGMLLAGIGADQPIWYRVFFWAAWLGIGLFVSCRTISSAREIIVHEGNEVEFVSWLARQRLSARDILSVRVTGGEQSQVVVLHAGGKIYLAGAFNEFHQFLTELKQANPRLSF